jgi:hypothetical protein
LDPSVGPHERSKGVSLANPEREADGHDNAVILRVIHSARDWPAGGWPE